MGKNIGFVSTRFAGTDGVTMEACKWARVFNRKGHNCFWFAGELEMGQDKSFTVPEAHFHHPQNIWINHRIFGKKKRKTFVTQIIHSLRSRLKTQLYKFFHRFDIDMLVAENTLTIPMHVPLGLALAEFIAETQIPTIAHHHDFYWERVRFSVNSVGDYLRMAFPPNLPNIEHVVINSGAREELALRTGISSTIIPNVLDFENGPVYCKKHKSDFNQSIGLQPDDIMILQPTRIIQRKGIEYAVELVKALKDPRYKLVVSHEAGDEGFEYADWLKEYAIERGVDLRLLKTRIANPLNHTSEPTDRYSLWDIYPYADFITYPSLIEGFGNAFLEAVYFKKPILINRYSTFIRDIEPLGFDLIVMNGYLDKKTVQKVNNIIKSPEECKKMTEHNYRTATNYYSYSVLKRHLVNIMTNFFGSPSIKETNIQKLFGNNINPGYFANHNLDANTTGYISDISRMMQRYI